MKNLFYIFIIVSFVSCGKPFQLEGFLALKNGEIKVGNSNADSYQKIKSARQYRF